MPPMSQPLAIKGDAKDKICLFFQLTVLSIFAFQLFGAADAGTKSRFL